MRAWLVAWRLHVWVIREKGINLILALFQHESLHVFRHKNFCTLVDHPLRLDNHDIDPEGLAIWLEPCSGSDDQTVIGKWEGVFRSIFGPTVNDDGKRLLITMRNFRKQEQREAVSPYLSLFAGELKLTGNIDAIEHRFEPGLVQLTHRPLFSGVLIDFVRRVDSYNSINSIKNQPPGGG